MKISNLNLESENKGLKEKIQEFTVMIKKISQEKHQSKENTSNNQEINNLKLHIVNLLEEKDNQENVN